MAEKKDVAEDHKRLAKDFAAAQEKRIWIQGVIKDARMSAILSRFESEIERSKEGLVLVEKKDLEAKQESVKARRDVLRQLREAYADDVSEAKAALERFEKENALFLQEPKKGKASKSA